MKFRKKKDIEASTATHSKDFIPGFSRGVEDEDTYNVSGYCSRDRFKKDSRQMDLGHGMGSVMDQIDLSPLEKLWSYSTQRRLQKFN